MKNLIVNQVKRIARLMLPSNYKEVSNRGSGRWTICGATAGWRIMVNQNLDITLVSAFTNAQIQLPPISSALDQPFAKTKNCVVHKAVLSSAPAWPPDDYVVMIIYGESKQLACFKAGNETWTLLQEAGSFYDDVILLDRGKFCAVDEYGKVVLCMPDSFPTVKELTKPWFFWGEKVYLVTMGDYLNLVVRFLEDKPDFGRQTYFKVYVWDYHKKIWTLVGDVANWTILLGHNHSIALPPNSIEGLRPCIHVFSLRNKTSEQLLCPSRDLQNIWQQQIVS